MFSVYAVLCRTANFLPHLDVMLDVNECFVGIVGLWVFYFFIQLYVFPTNASFTSGTRFFCYTQVIRFSRSIETFFSIFFIHVLQSSGGVMPYEDYVRKCLHSAVFL